MSLSIRPPHSSAVPVEALGSASAASSSLRFRRGSEEAVAVDWHLTAAVSDLLAVRDDEQRVDAASHGRRAAVGRDIRSEQGGCAKSGVSSAYLTWPSIFNFFFRVSNIIYSKERQIKQYT